MSADEQRPIRNNGVTNRLQRYRSDVPATGILVSAKRPARRTRWQSLQHALEGLAEAWATQPNLRLHVIFGVMVALAGVWSGLDAGQWLWVSLAVGLVIIAELLNTALERLVDLTVGELTDPLARIVKDLSAGVVFATCLLAVAIGCFVFLPHLLR
jgi:undecaprenol kinase